MTTNSMRATVEITSRIDEGAWRELVETRPDGNIFHTPEMFQVFARAEHHRPSLWAASGAAGSPLALLLPVEVALLEGPLRSWTSRTVVYGGLLCAGGPAGTRAVPPLLIAYKAAARGQALFTEVRHLSHAVDLLPALRVAGFSHEGHLNFLIRLDRPEGDLWRALSRTARQRVRSAERKGVVIEEVIDAADADDAYRLVERVYRRVGIPLAGRSIFRAARSILHPRGMLRIFTARLGERIIGTRFLLVHKGRMLEWYAGSDRAFTSYSPSELLVWHALRWGRAQGFEVFDFGGAGRPGEHYGPREFKAKFGGELVDFGRDVLVHKPLRFWASRVGYAVARLLWRGAGTGKDKPD